MAESIIKLLFKNRIKLYGPDHVKLNKKNKWIRKKIVHFFVKIFFLFTYFFLFSFTWSGPICQRQNYLLCCTIQILFKFLNVRFSLVRIKILNKFQFRLTNFIRVWLSSISFCTYSWFSPWFGRSSSLTFDVEGMVLVALNDSAKKNPYLTQALLNF